MTVRVRCPSPDCGDVFAVSELRLGRNIYCLSCGVRMTARPLAVEAELRQRGRGRVDVAGAPGSVPRLPLVGLLDNVRSLWNVGSMFRTADACGVRALVLTGITGSPPRPEIAKTALGAETALDWSYHPDPAAALQELLGQGYTAVAVEASSRATRIDRIDWPARACIVVGNEVAGVSAPVLEACRLHARIPMLGTKRTLNVAVAFGIAAHRAALALIQSNPEVRDNDGVARAGHRSPPPGAVE